MAATITNELTLDTVVPKGFTTRTSERQIATISHTIIGSADPYISFEPVRLRSGEHVLVFASASDALAAETVLAQIGAFELDYPEQPGWNMRFILLGGSLMLEQDDVYLNRWTLRFGFQEIAA